MRKLTAAAKGSRGPHSVGADYIPSTQVSSYLGDNDPESDTGRRPVLHMASFSGVGFDTAPS